MKTFKKVQTTVSELGQHECDLCREDLKDTPRPHKYVAVKCTEFAYEGGELKREEFDICADCWEDKILPLFEKEFGIKPRVTS